MRAIIFALALALIASSSFAAGTDRNAAQHQIKLLQIYSKRDCPTKVLSIACKTEADKLVADVADFEAKYTAAGCLDRDTPACEPLYDVRKALSKRVVSFVETYKIPVTKADLDAATK